MAEAVKIKQSNGELQMSSIALLEIQNNLLLNMNIDLVNRTLLINESIDEKTVDMVNKGLTILSSNTKKPEPITIKINSGGGSIYDAWAIVALIKNCKCDVNTEVLGSCMSAATTVFAAGKHRRAHSNSFFLFHETSSDLGHIKKSDTKIIAAHFEKEEAMYCAHLAAASKKRARFWHKVLNTKGDVYVSAKELLKTGLVHEIF